MRAKTKRRIKHILFRKKLVSRKTSRRVMRSASVIILILGAGVLTLSFAGSTAPKPHTVLAGQQDTIILNAPKTPEPTPEQSGRGSWYALGLPAPDSLTCASRTYPRGSYLEVTNTKNGRIIVCRVNDYGPQASTGRAIDLSRGSFQALDNLGTGTIPVTIRQVASNTQ